MPPEKLPKAMVRPPAVAGRFYSSDANQLARDVDEYSAAPSSGKKTHAIACIVPHAGLMYSGHVAGAVLTSIDIPNRIILIGPRHFPRGSPMAILTDGSWQTPFGEAPIDSTLGTEIARACPTLREDFIAHEREHSLEVELPFLQRLAPDFRFVPIVLATDRYPVLEELGQAVAKVVKARKEPVLVIASTDMNHYESDAVTRAKDERAIGRILALDPRGLFDTVRSEGITMCGYAATTAVVVAAIDLGAKEATLVKYATSGDITGDPNEVVGYAGLVLS